MRDFFDSASMKGKVFYLLGFIISGIFIYAKLSNMPFTLLGLLPDILAARINTV